MCVHTDFFGRANLLNTVIVYLHVLVNFFRVTGSHIFNRFLQAFWDFLCPLLRNVFNGEVSIADYYCHDICVFFFYICNSWLFSWMQEFAWKPSLCTMSKFLVEPFLLTFICVCLVRSSHVICIVNSTSPLDKLFLLWEQMLLHTVKTKKMRKSCQRHGTVKFYFQGSRKDFPSDQTTALGGQRLQKIIARYIWHRSKRQLVLLPTTAARRFGIVFNEAMLHYVHV